MNIDKLYLKELFKFVEATGVAGPPEGIPLKDWNVAQFKFWDSLAEKGYVPGSSVELLSTGKANLMRPFLQKWAEIGWDLIRLVPKKVGEFLPIEVEETFFDMIKRKIMEILPEIIFVSEDDKDSRKIN